MFENKQEDETNIYFWQREITIKIVFVRLEHQTLLRYYYSKIL